MFCVSGIILNHRTSVNDINIGRKYLPSDYKYSAWNNGLFRGTLRIGDEASGDLLIYGNNGIWKYNPSGVSDFNLGFPSGVDHRNIKGMAVTSEKDMFAASQFGLYRYTYDDNKWHEVRALSVLLHDDEKLSDITTQGDSLIVLGRSYVYISLPPYNVFERIELKSPEGYNGRVSLFKTIWMLHSGEIFGTIGKLVVDFLGVVLSVICITGLYFWLFPKYMRYKRKNGNNCKDFNFKFAGATVKYSLFVHDVLGKYAFHVLLFLIITGWCLRPPVLLALVFSETRPVPYSKLDTDNPWNDKLRMLKYDSSLGDWLLSSSDGFYSFKSLNDIPVKLEKVPPVSVMGINVFQKDYIYNCNSLIEKHDCDVWIVGSFSGLYKWNRSSGIVTDYFTGEQVVEVSGPPFGKFAVAGYSVDFTNTDLSGSYSNTADLRDDSLMVGTIGIRKPIIVEYYNGTDLLPMPNELSSLPISLWNLALEVHTGRIYTFLGNGTLVFIFFIGLASIWCLYTGWRVRKRS